MTLDRDMLIAMFVQGQLANPHCHTTFDNILVASEQMADDIIARRKPAPEAAPVASATPLTGLPEGYEWEGHLSTSAVVRMPNGTKCKLTDGGDLVVSFPGEWTAYVDSRVLTALLRRAKRLP